MGLSAKKVVGSRTLLSVGLHITRRFEALRGPAEPIAMAARVRRPQGDPTSLVMVMAAEVAAVRARKATIEATAPATGWINDQTMKRDVMFLWDEIDHPGIVEELPIKPEIHEVRYVPGAVIWRVDRGNATRSGIKVVGTPLYQQMTIRNCNTARKLLQLMEAAGGR